MADEGDERRLVWMDLNLYLGLPRPPCPRSLLRLEGDLELDLTEMPGAVEPLDSHVPYSPSHASYNPGLLPGDPLHPEIGSPGQEYTPDDPYGLLGPPIEGTYSPIRDLPTVQENDELLPEAYDPLSPTWPPDSASPRGGEPHMPYSPAYTHFSVSPLSLDEVDFGVYRPLPRRGGEFLSREDGSSSRQDLFRSPEFRLRRLIEASHLYSMPPPFDSERSNFGRPSSPISAQLAHDIMSSQRDLEMNKKHEAPAKHVAAEGSDDETKEKSRNSANFECNICLDMAKEPVVTSCGHLFCWPCLYQWLHLHSDHRECPVCKGEVIESNITPIYGRGSSESSDEKKLGKNEESDLQIPARPRGNRFESIRQQVRSFPRRSGEGTAPSWRRLVDPRIRNRNNGDPNLPGTYDGGHPLLSRIRNRNNGDPNLPGTYDGGHPLLTRIRNRNNGDSNLPGTYDGGHPLLTRIRNRNNGDPNLLGTDDGGHPLLTRTRTRRMQREEEIPEGESIAREIGLPTDIMPIPQSSSSSLLFRDGIDNLRRVRFSLNSLPSSERLADMAVDLGSVDWRFVGDRYAASTSYVNPPAPEPPTGRFPVPATLAADQASASSTMAVIQGDVAVSDASVDPNSAGSSRSYRRRGRSSTSGSLDVDGGSLHARRRRRESQEKEKRTLSEGRPVSLDPFPEILSNQTQDKLAKRTHWNPCLRSVYDSV